MILSLKKEHDKNAIAAYHKSEKVGYVAAGDYTNADITMCAFFLKNLQDNSKVEYLFFYRLNYRIAAILRDG